MNDEDKDFMRQWAQENGASVRQRTVRQETTKYKSGTMPLNVYQQELQGERVDVWDERNEEGNKEPDEYSSDETDESSAEVVNDGDRFGDLSEPKDVEYPEALHF